MAAELEVGQAPGFHLTGRKGGTVGRASCGGLRGSAAHAVLHIHEAQTLPPLPLLRHLS